MSDTEIIQGEVENLQEAVLEVDERLDAIEENGGSQDNGGGEAQTNQCLGRIEATLAQMSSCLERLEARTAEQIQEATEAAETAAEAATAAAEMSALAAVADLAEEDATSEDIEAAPEGEVEEVQAPPEETESRQSSMSWWERMLLAR